MTTTESVGSASPERAPATVAELEQEREAVADYL